MVASELIAAVRRRIDDPSVPTDAQVLKDLNDARNILAADTKCFLTQYSRSSVTSAVKFTLPTDCIDVSMIRFWSGDSVTKLDPISEQEWRELILNDTSTIPSNYWKNGRDIYLAPRNSAAAGTEVLYGALGVSDTSLSVDGSSALPTVGKIIIDTEVISYIGKSYDSTTDKTTFSNLTRGDEGTTAATHNDDSTVTERDIHVDYYQVPYAMSIGAFSTTLTGDHTSTATTITVASNATFPSSGKIKIDSEIISYTGKSSTTGFTGCLRGQDGTAPASHSGTTAVTDPDTTVEPVFSLHNNAHVLVWYACWQAKIEDTDDVQSTGANYQGETFRQLWEREKQAFAAYASSANYNSRDRYRTITEVCG